MIRLFKAARQQKAIETGSSKTARFISNLILKAQTKFATFMSRYESKLTTGQRKIALFVFLLFMGTFAGSLLYKGVFQKKQESPSYLHHNSIYLPPNITLPDSLDLKLLQEEYNQFRLRQSRTDSLHIK